MPCQLMSWEKVGLVQVDEHFNLLLFHEDRMYMNELKCTLLSTSFLFDKTRF